MARHSMLESRVGDNEVYVVGSASTYPPRGKQERSFDVAKGRVAERVNSRCGWRVENWES